MLGDTWQKWHIYWKDLSTNIEHTTRIVRKIIYCLKNRNYKVCFWWNVNISKSSVDDHDYHFGKLESKWLNNCGFPAAVIKCHHSESFIRITLINDIIVCGFCRKHHGGHWSLLLWKWNYKLDLIKDIPEMEKFQFNTTVAVGRYCCEKELQARFNKRHSRNGEISI